MERARGIRRLVQSILFPDLDHLIDSTEALDRRMGVLDKTVGLLDQSLGALDERADQLDKGMVQMDHGLNRVDREMVRLSGGMDKFNKGIDQLNKDVDEREKDLTIRLEKLKAKLESGHVRAMGEVTELLEDHAFEDRNSGQPHEVKSRLLHEPERARAISELSAALGPQAPVEEFKSQVEPELEHARALQELAALLGSARRREEPKRAEAKRDEPRDLHELRDPMLEEADRFARVSNGNPPPLDFAAILEHIRKREAVG